MPLIIITSLFYALLPPWFSAIRQPNPPFTLLGVFILPPAGPKSVRSALSYVLSAFALHGAPLFSHRSPISTLSYVPMWTTRVNSTPCRALAMYHLHPLACGSLIFAPFPTSIAHPSVLRQNFEITKFLENLQQNQLSFKSEVFASPPVVVRWAR